MISKRSFFLIAGILCLASTTSRLCAQSETYVYLTPWGTFGSGNGQFEVPLDVALDTYGHVYVMDYLNHRIRKFTSQGVYLTQWGTTGTGAGEFRKLQGLTLDVGGNVYVADTENNRIQKFAPRSTPVAIKATTLSTFKGLLHK